MELRERLRFLGGVRVALRYESVGRVRVALRYESVGGVRLFSDMRVSVEEG